MSFIELKKFFIIQVILSLIFCYDWQSYIKYNLTVKGFNLYRTLSNQSQGNPKLFTHYYQPDTQNMDTEIGIIRSISYLDPSINIEAAKLGNVSITDQILADLTINSEGHLFADPTLPLSPTEEVYYYSENGENKTKIVFSYEDNQITGYFHLNLYSLNPQVRIKHFSRIKANYAPLIFNPRISYNKNKLSSIAIWWKQQKSDINCFYGISISQNIQYLQNLVNMGTIAGLSEYIINQITIPQELKTSAQIKDIKVYQQYWIVTIELGKIHQSDYPHRYYFVDKFYRLVNGTLIYYFQRQYFIENHLSSPEFSLQYSKNINIRYTVAYYEYKKQINQLLLVNSIINEKYQEEEILFQQFYQMKYLFPSWGQDELIGCNKLKWMYKIDYQSYYTYTTVVFVTYTPEPPNNVGSGGSSNDGYTQTIIKLNGNYTLLGYAKDSVGCGVFYNEDNGEVQVVHQNGSSYVLPVSNIEPKSLQYTVSTDCLISKAGNDISILNYETGLFIYDSTPSGWTSPQFDESYRIAIHGNNLYQLINNKYALIISSAFEEHNIILSDNYNKFITTVDGNNDNDEDNKQYKNIDNPTKVLVLSYKQLTDDKIQYSVKIFARNIMSLQWKQLSLGQIKGISQGMIPQISISPQFDYFYIKTQNQSLTTNPISIQFKYVNYSAQTISAIDIPESQFAQVSQQSAISMSQNYLHYHKVRKQPAIISNLIQAASSGYLQRRQIMYYFDRLTIKFRQIFNELEKQWSVGYFVNAQIQQIAYQSQQVGKNEQSQQQSPTVQYKMLKIVYQLRQVKATTLRISSELTVFERYIQLASRQQLAQLGQGALEGQTSQLQQSISTINTAIIYNPYNQNKLSLCFPGCTDCLNQNTCKKCSDGYYLISPSIGCEICPSYTKTCTFDQPYIQIQQCLLGYYQVIDQSITVVNISNCKAQCDSNCRSCINDSMICTSCNVNYFLNLTTSVCTKCKSHCSSCLNESFCSVCQLGYTPTSSGSCIKCPFHCSICNPSSISQCIECRTGYQLIADPNIYNQQCQACPTNCLSCSSGACNKCKEYYRIQNGTCISKCQSPCQSCSADNSSFCLSCLKNYILSSNDLNDGNANGSCVPDVSCNSDKSCTACPIQYQLQKNGVCLQCNLSANCRSCSNLNINQCNMCQHNFHLSSNFTCQKCTNGCSLCDSPVTCRKCLPGFTLSGNQSISQCLACSPPCSACRQSPSTCESCVSGYSMIGWKCISNYYIYFSMRLKHNISLVSSRQFEVMQDQVLSVIKMPLDSDIMGYQMIQNESLLWGYINLNSNLQEQVALERLINKYPNDSTIGTVVIAEILFVTSEMTFSYPSPDIMNSVISQHYLKQQFILFELQTNSSTSLFYLSYYHLNQTSSQIQIIQSKLILPKLTNQFISINKESLNCMLIYQSNQNKYYLYKLINDSIQSASSNRKIVNDYYADVTSLFQQQSFFNKSIAWLKDQVMIGDGCRSLKISDKLYYQFNYTSANNNNNTDSTASSFALLSNVIMYQQYNFLKFASSQQHYLGFDKELATVLTNKGLYVVGYDSSGDLQSLSTSEQLPYQNVYIWRYQERLVVYSYGTNTTSNGTSNPTSNPTTSPAQQPPGQYQFLLQIYTITETSILKIDQVENTSMLQPPTVQISQLLTKIIIHYNHNTSSKLKQFIGRNINYRQRNIRKIQFDSHQQFNTIQWQDQIYLKVLDNFLYMKEINKTSDADSNTGNDNNAAGNYSTILYQRGYALVNNKMLKSFEKVLNPLLKPNQLDLIIKSIDTDAMKIQIIRVYSKNNFSSGNALQTYQTDNFYTLFEDNEYFFLSQILPLDPSTISSSSTLNNYFYLQLINQSLSNDGSSSNNNYKVYNSNKQFKWFQLKYLILDDQHPQIITTSIRNIRNKQIYQNTTSNEVQVQDLTWTKTGTYEILAISQQYDCAMVYSKKTQQLLILYADYQHQRAMYPISNLFDQIYNNQNIFPQKAQIILYHQCQYFIIDNIFYRLNLTSKQTSSNNSTNDYNYQVSKNGNSLNIYELLNLNLNINLRNNFIQEQQTTSILQRQAQFDSNYNVAILNNSVYIQTSLKKVIGNRYKKLFDSIFYQENQIYVNEKADKMILLSYRKQKSTSYGFSVNVFRINRKIYYQTSKVTTQSTFFYGIDDTSSNQTSVENITAANSTSQDLPNSQNSQNSSSANSTNTTESQSYKITQIQEINIEQIIVNIEGSTYSGIPEISISQSFQIVILKYSISFDNRVNTIIKKIYYQQLKYSTIPFPISLSQQYFQNFVVELTDNFLYYKAKCANSAPVLALFCQEIIFKFSTSLNSYQQYVQFQPIINNVQTWNTSHIVQHNSSVRIIYSIEQTKIIYNKITIVTKIINDSFQNYLITKQSRQALYIEDNKFLQCQQGCINCVNSNVCLNCTVNFILNNSTNICLKCTGYCKTCQLSNQAFCLTCISGFWLNGNVCSPCHSSCQQCKQSYNFSCSSCPVRYYLNNETQCVKCSDRCDVCTNSSYCKSCQPGYVPIEDGSCTKCPLDCSYCNSKAPTQCIACRNGFQLVAINNVAQCQRCQKNCKSCKKGICTECRKGFRVKNGVCVVSCRAPCRECSETDPYSCKSCLGDYIFKQGACRGDISCNLNSNCSSCPFGYFILQNICYECQTPENCESCSTTDITKCVACLDGFYLMNEGICDTCSDDCKICQSKSTCNECVEGYTLSGNQTTSKCIKCLSPCQKCSQSALNCISCSQGYQISGWTCVSLIHIDFEMKLDGSISQLSRESVLKIKKSISQNSNKPLQQINLISIVSGSITIHSQVQLTDSFDYYNTLNSLVQSFNQVSDIGGFAIISYSITNYNPEIANDFNQRLMILNVIESFGLEIVICIFVFIVYRYIKTSKQKEIDQIIKLQIGQQISSQIIFQSRSQSFKSENHEKKNMQRQ